MLLVLDVGNTQTVVGLYGHDADADGPTAALGAERDLLDHWRISTNAERTSDELALLVQEFLAFHGFSFDEDVDGVALCSSVPSVTTAVREMSQRYFGFAALVVEPGIKTGMPILYENPKEVGADRIADAVAAFDLYGGPTIVVDFGTATTLEAISPRGEYLGGAILPGVEISLDALFGRAAALRRVELLEPRSVIGKNTVESIQSGALYGFAAQVDGICERMQDEIGPSTVVATGGLAALIAPQAKAIQHHEPWLTLHGLRLIFEKNRP
ncbi:MAG: type III pantothenate kinase [Acidimicrobiales bacterium]